MYILASHFPHLQARATISVRMSSGPSPLIPLLLVGAIGWLTLGPQLLEGWSLAAEVQESWLVPVFMVPTILFLLIFFVHEIVILPLILIMVVFAFRTALIAPLVLLLVIVVTVHYSGTYTVERQSRLFGTRNDNDDQGGFGFGAFMLFMLFLIVSSLFCEEECYWWISVILVFPFVYFFSSS